MSEQAQSAGGAGASYAGLDQAIFGMAGISLPNTPGALQDVHSKLFENIPALFSSGKPKWMDTFIQQLGADFANASQGVSFGEGHMATPMASPGSGGHGMEL